MHNYISNLEEDENIRWMITMLKIMMKMGILIRENMNKIYIGHPRNRAMGHPNGSEKDKNTK
jgi:hypothetical protein